MTLERHPVPRWLVAAAGTGGTSATLGRFVRYRQHATQLCVPDPEGSVFAGFHATGDAGLQGPGSRIEGIGRPRVEPSYMRGVIDRAIEVPDVQSIGAMLALSDHLGRPVGPSTGTHLVAMLALATEMQAQGQTGSIVSLLCDSGWRYQSTYFQPDWLGSWLQGDAQTQRRHFEGLLRGPAPTSEVRT